MHGDIRVHSMPGMGTRFEVRLPFEAPIEYSDMHPTVPFVPTLTDSARLSGISILVAEDNEVNSMILREHLLAEGAQVAVVGDGQEAIDRIRKDGAGAFNIVLMDIQMPNMNGHEATQRILEIAPGLPVVGQTAHAFVEERDACIASGMVDHISKPIDPDQMVAVILRHATNHHQSLAPG
jgi:CheY-like chemotaxis protein